MKFKKLNKFSKRVMKFKREILKLCFSKKQLTYYEIAYQCKYDVLETNSYNDNIMSRIFRKDLHLPD